jgi:hypothetical protein
MAIPMDSSQALYKGGTDETCDRARCGKKKDGNFRRWNNVLELRVQRNVRFNLMVIHEELWNAEAMSLLVSEGSRFS